MNLDEELLLDAQDDALAVEYIRTHIPQELQERLTEEQLYYFLDVIVDYFVESGVLDVEADSDGFVEVDEEAIARYVAKKAAKEKMGNFSADDLLFVVRAQMDYEESKEEE